MAGWIKKTMVATVAAGTVLGGAGVAAASQAEAPESVVRLQLTEPTLSIAPTGIRLAPQLSLSLGTEGPGEPDEAPRRRAADRGERVERATLITLEDNLVRVPFGVGGEAQPVVSFFPGAEDSLIAPQDGVVVISVKF